MDLGLRDKIALVTGAGSGIGRAIALSLAGEGTCLVAADVRQETASATAAAATACGVEALGVALDVTNYGQAQAVVQQAVQRFGRVDILVNCAGIALTPKPLLDTTPEELQRVFAINLKGVWHCAQFAARDMIKRRSGRIINIA